MKKIKMFDLIEKSFSDLKKTNKKIWIIGIIISIFSGGLIIQESFDYDMYSDYTYEDEYYMEEEVLESEFEDILITEYLGYIFVFGLIFIAIIFAISILVCVISYYLYYSEYESLFDTKLSKASLGLVVKVNLIVGFKILLGLILFIVPGIITALKYAPVNYILCKYPELSSNEVLDKSKELTKGFKWKIFNFNLFITIVGAIIVAVCSPSLFVYGYILIDILDMLITFVLTTFIIVYTGLFNINLYKTIED